MSIWQESRIFGRSKAILALLLCTCVALIAPSQASALNLPPGFQADTLDIPRSSDTSDFINALQSPTALDFAPNGRMFVAERNGRVKTFDSVNDKTPALSADLTRDVMALQDRGLLGLKLDPEYPSQPYLYLAYTHDAPKGGTAPTGVDDASGSDTSCEDEPPYADCLASGRIVRLEVDPNDGMVLGGSLNPPQQVLVEDWCQQSLTHSIGDIEFDSTGALLAGGGEGAAWEVADNGQFGNVCNDPEDAGGSLRSQDLRTPESPQDPTGYSGSIIRIDRETGAPKPGNPLIDGPDVSARRILLYGLRNPFRFELRPGTNDLYIGDVGWFSWEELNRATSPPVPGQAPLNFGWPCYEGGELSPQWPQLAEDDKAPLCQSLYDEATPSVTGPFFRYIHGEAQIFPGDGCEFDNGASTSGLAFYQPSMSPSGDDFPASYNGALFIADASRGCVWAMFADGDGVPDPSTIVSFTSRESEGELFTPVDITLGPEGALYLPNIFDDSIERVRYFSNGPPPVARIEADKTFGPASPVEPLEIEFDASGSSDAEGEDLSYSWDLDGDGVFTGPDLPVVEGDYEGEENVTVAVRVIDEENNIDEARLTVYPDDLGPPEPDVDVSEAEWTVGDTIPFSATATDPDGETPRFYWDVTIKHCPSVTLCHSHPYTSFTDVAGGEIVAPPHEYPSHLALTLTVRDERGLSARVSKELFPEILTVEMESDPPGIALTFNGDTQTSPFDGLIISGSSANVSAPAMVTIGESTYEFDEWSDGGARAHTISTTESMQLVASYELNDPPTAADDQVTLAEEDPATAIDVLANDSDLDGGPKSIKSVTQPTSGAVAITGGGTGLTYEPNPNYCNDPPGTTPDDFTYKLNGGSVATVSVIVTCVDDLPVAVNDSATVSKDALPTAIDVLANDIDVDGGSKSVVSKSNGAHGTVAIIGGGASLTYSPVIGYCGLDSFAYTLNGGSQATVAVTVCPGGILQPGPIQPSPTPFPEAKRLTFHLRSKPAGVELRVDRVKRRAPFDLEIDSAKGVWVTAPRHAMRRGRHLHFRRWSNRGKRRQLVAAGKPAMLWAIYGVAHPHRRAR